MTNILGREVKTRNVMMQFALKEEKSRMSGMETGTVLNLDSLEQFCKFEAV
jgi:hypothetical protein